MQKLIHLDLIGCDMGVTWRRETINVLDHIEKMDVEYLRDTISCLENSKTLEDMYKNILSITRELSTTYAGRTTEVYYEQKVADDDGYVNAFGACILEMTCCPGTEKALVIRGIYHKKDAKARDEVLASIFRNIRKFWEQEECVCVSGDTL